MLRKRLSVLFLTAGFLTGLVAGASAAEEPLAANVTFVTSTGYWEESGDPATVLDPAGRPKPLPPAAASRSDVRKGYYKLIAIRQPEGNAHIVLQQIALDPSGPSIVSSAELEEFSRIKAFVTDIRPETSDGITSQPGLFATVYLRFDATSTEVESWTVLIDELGDIKIERASN